MYVVCESCIVRDNKFLSTAFTPALRYSLLQVHVDLYSSWFICTQKESECVCKSKGWNTCTLTKVCCSNTLQPHTCSKNSGIVHMCDTTHSCVCRDSFICVTRLSHMSDMTHSHVWHDSFICVPWLVHTWHMTHSHVIVCARDIVGHHLSPNPFICVPWLVHTWDMTHLHVPACARDIVRHHQSNDFFICVPWLVHIWDMTQLREPACARDAIHHHCSFICVRGVSFIRGTWLIYMCLRAHETLCAIITHSHVWHDSFICVPWLVQTWDMTHSHVPASARNIVRHHRSHISFMCVYIWLTNYRVREWFIDI